MLVEDRKNSELSHEKRVRMGDEGGENERGGEIEDDDDDEVSSNACPCAAVTENKMRLSSATSTSEVTE